MVPREDREVIEGLKVGQCYLMEYGNYEYRWRVKVVKLLDNGGFEGHTILKGRNATPTHKHMTWDRYGISSESPKMHGLFYPYTLVDEDTHEPLVIVDAKPKQDLWVL